ncbi:MAG: hypothetical protein P4M08_08405 [Oligoflexia bacterium]|nr:hypothetical protein [Oligoflexia bacterium]
MSKRKHPFISHLTFWFALGSAVSALGWSTSWSAETAPAGAPIGVKACQGGESWQLGDLEATLNPRFIDTIHSFLGKRMTTVRGFAEALAMRRQAKTPEEKFFAEYWISRALYGSRMVHVAKDGFALLASREVSDKTAGIQLAAVECLVQIHNIYPAIPIPDSVYARIPDYQHAAKSIGRTDIVNDLATHYAIAKAATGPVSDAEGQRLVSYVAGSAHHEALIRGLLAAKKNDHSEVIRNLRAFVDTSGMPNHLQRYVTQAHLLLARSYYSVEQYDHAIDQFKKVDRKSNDLADSLQEMSWAYLMAEDYKEAVGTAIILQAGGLRKTYTPEAPMVMSMAMNEICQYPESIKAANTFRRSYESVYQWLESWKKGEKDGKRQNLYKLAVQYLKRQGDTPDRLGSEWLRSPVFIADQDEVNLLFDEKTAASSLTAWGSKEQNALARSIVDEIHDLKPTFKKELARRQQEGKPFSSNLQAKLEHLRDSLISFRNLQHAAPVWKAVLANQLEKNPVIEHRLIAGIESDLKKRSERMHDQLEEIAENIELIEVEIYNGASQDIIWQNAHPDFKKIAKELGDDSGNRAPASKVWDWGKASNITEDGAEIWEDELGSFKANLPDNCESKDKYLALKATKIGRN